MRRRVCALKAKRKLRGGRRAGKGSPEPETLEAARFIRASEIAPGQTARPRATKELYAPAARASPPVKSLRPLQQPGAPGAFHQRKQEEEREGRNDYRLASARFLPVGKGYAEQLCEWQPSARTGEPTRHEGKRSESETSGPSSPCTQGSVLATQAPEHSTAPPGALPGERMNAMRSLE